MLNGVYTPKEVKHIVQWLEEYNASRAHAKPNTGRYPVQNLLEAIPPLKELVFNVKLRTIVQEGMGKKYVLRRATYTEGIGEEASAVYQDVGEASVEVLKSQYTLRVHLDAVTAEQGALRVYSKSHFDIHDSLAIEAIQLSKSSTCCEVAAGGIHILKPLSLRKASTHAEGQPPKVIELVVEPR